MGLVDNQTVVDLGAGDGLVIFEAAQNAWYKKLNTKFVAVEINPVLIAILFMRRLFHPNKKNIKILRADIFKLGSATIPTHHVSPFTFYVYISPWLMNKLFVQLKKSYKKFILVSYFYPLKGLKPQKKLSELHEVFVYKVEY